jgi:hypothetical protein
MVLAIILRRQMLARKDAGMLICEAKWINYVGCRPITDMPQTPVNVCFQE